MANTQTEQIDVQALIAEVGAEVDALIKAEQERLDNLKKSEESKEASAKEESSKESMEKNDQKAEEVKKDEGSGFESPAPEASADASAAPAADAASTDASQAQSAESLESMVQSLSEEELNELMQVVQMEMQSRQASAAPAADASQAAPAPDASAAASAAPEMGKMEAAYKKEIEDVRNQLKKSEETTGKLENAVVAMTDLIDKMVSRPVQKAVTDIRAIDFVDKGEKDLKKSEETAATDEQVRAKLTKMSGDPKQLATLTKSERETLSSYFVSKKTTPEVLKIYSK